MTKKSPVTARVLVADDSVVCRSVLVLLLENAGYQVFSANDGREAIRLLKKNAVDAVILDNDMPHLDGLGALTELRAFLPDLPVVVCSGTVLPDQAKRYEKLGVDALMIKPVDPRVLRDRVAHILTQQRSERTGFHHVSLPGEDLTAATSAPSPLFAGLTPLAGKLQVDLDRMHHFRSVAIIDGPAGSGRFELALTVATDPQTHQRVCHADEFNADHLDTLLKTATTTDYPVMLIILEAERLDPERQTLLEELVLGQHAPLASLAKRLRIILCTQGSLNDLEFNEFLLMRAATATIRLPSLEARRDDWPAISDAILQRSGTPRTFTAEARQWIIGQPWPGDYIQLHRTLELALRHNRLLRDISVDQLKVAYAEEATCTDPLFHDMLFHVHSGTDT